MQLDAIQSGNHEVRREAYDFFVYRFRAGQSTAQNIAALAELELQAWPELDRVYSMTVLAEEHSILAGALTEAALSYRTSPPRISAFVTRKFVLRTAMEFLIRTVRGLGLDIQVRFFQDESSARTWLERRRAGRVSVA